MELKKLLIYPFDIEANPILRHPSLLFGYEITSLVSPSGWGLCGKEAGTGKSPRMVIRKDFEEMLSTVDTVLFIEPFNKVDMEKVVYPKIIKTIEAGKSILCTVRLKEEFYMQILEKCAVKGVSFQYFNQTECLKLQENVLDDSERLEDIHTPVVFVLGMAERANKFEIQLSLREHLISQGYRVSQIGSRNYCELFGFHSFPSFMWSANISEVKKIVRFNRYIKKIEAEEQPDVILIGIPGGVLPFNKQFTNHFGIFAYEVSQVLSPDAVIFSILYEDVLPEFFEKQSRSIRYRLGYDVDFYNLSNARFDWNNSEHRDSAQYITLDSEFVDSKAEQYRGAAVPIFNVLNEKDAAKLAESIVDKLSGYNGSISAV